MGDQDGDELDGGQNLHEGGGSSSNKQSDENDEEQHQDSNGIVHYDQIDLDLDEDDHDGREDGHDGLDDDDDIEDQYQQDSNDVDDDGENEVSINLEDAIATAEEINKREFNDNHRGVRQESDEDDNARSPYGDEEDMTSAQEIAGIVTDGHNQKDGFD